MTINETPAFGKEIPCKYDDNRVWVRWDREVAEPTIDVIIEQGTTDQPTASFSPDDAQLLINALQSEIDAITPLSDEELKVFHIMVDAAQEKVPGLTLDAIAAEADVALSNATRADRWPLIETFWDLVGPPERQAAS